MTGTGRLLAVLGVLLAAAGTAAGQMTYFGKNKVQTRDYAFLSLETEHFRILFYPGGETMAEFSAKAAEDFYDGLARDLGFDLEDRVPLMLYLSPGQFSETNVILDVIEEGVGGFSELFKNRIVVPFNGSYSDLYHVIGHELVHIFEFQMYYRSQLSSLLGAVGEFQIPLWVMEGFAEYQSGWVNVESDVFMRDLLLNNRLVSLEDLHDGMGYLVYREGEAFFRYVDEKYGRKKVYEFMHALKNRRNADATFAAVFGMDVERFSREWEKWLRAKYWPQVAKLKNFDGLARRLTDHREDGSVYNTAPAISASGTKIAMITDRREYADCYVISAMDGKVLKRLVKGGRSGGFENMHLLRPGVAWSPDEKLVAVVTTSAGRDNVAVVEYRSGRVRRRLATGLDAVYSPCFSPDGRRVAFVGLRNGFSDVYVVDVAGGEPQRITYDMYDDRDPSFSPGGDTIVYVSDRPDPGAEWRPGAQAVWLKPEGSQPRRLTERSGGYGHPVFFHTGEHLAYTGSDSAHNICVYSLTEGRVVAKTDFIGNASHLSLSRDDRKLAFAYFDDVGWDIAVISDPLEQIPRVPDSVPGYRAAADTVAFAREGLDFDKVKPARFRLTPDYAVGAASYTSGRYGGLSGVLNIALSDMLGDHRFEIYTDLYGDILNSDLILQYWLLPYQTDFGLVLFQYSDIPYYYPGVRVVERINRGGQIVGGYPFDKYLRAELGMTVLASQVTDWRVSPDRLEYYPHSRWTEWVTYAGPALVFDNTYWTWQGPARGTRTRIGADLSLPFASDREFYDLYGDLRNYQRIGRRYVFASRLFAIGGLGRNADKYYLGGEYVRGYRWGEFYADSLTGPGLLLGGAELRYPFVDKLDLAFPLPISIGGIRGVAFLDAGLVLRDSLRIWDSPNRRFDDLKLGTGAGIRIQISYFSLMFDWAYPLSATTDKGWKFVFGIGTDF